MFGMKPRVKNEVKETDGTFIGGTEYSGDLSIVENSPVFQPALIGFADDIANLEYFVENPKDDGMTVLAETYINEVLPNILPEIASKAYVYGESYSVMYPEDLGVFFYKGRKILYPSQLVPIDMSSTPTIEDNTIELADGSVFDLDTSLRIIFSTRHGKVYPAGNLLRKPIMYLDTSEEEWVTSTANNARGVMVLTKTQDADTIPENKLKQIINNYGKVRGVAYSLPFGNDVKILASPSKGGDFQSLVLHLTQEILSIIRQQWLMNATATPGTYGSLKAVRQASIDMIVNKGQRVAIGLTEFLNRIAEMNGIRPSITIGVRSSYKVDTTPDDTLKTLQGIALLISNITPMVTPEQAKQLYEMVGLQYYAPPKPDSTEPTEPIKESQAGFDSLNDWLDSKKTEWVRLIRNYAGRHIKISGRSTLKSLLRLENETDLIAIWSALEVKINGLRSSENLESEFDKVWSWFFERIKKWLH